MAPVSSAAVEGKFVEVEGMRLITRLTLIVRDQRIEQVFYPVFPPNESAAQVIDWLERHPL